MPRTFFRCLNGCTEHLLRNDLIIKELNDGVLSSRCPHCGGRISVSIPMRELYDKHDTRCTA